MPAHLKVSGEAQTTCADTSPFRPAAAMPMMKGLAEFVCTAKPLCKSDSRWSAGVGLDRWRLRSRVDSPAFSKSLSSSTNRVRATGAHRWAPVQRLQTLASTWSRPLGSRSRKVKDPHEPEDQRDREQIHGHLGAVRAIRIADKCMHQASE